MFCHKIEVQHSGLSRAFGARMPAKPRAGACAFCSIFRD
jgi:hypothetical protein